MTGGASEVPRRQTVEDEVQVLRQALGWLLEVHDLGVQGPRDEIRNARAWMFAQNAFDATNPNGEPA